MPHAIRTVLLGTLAAAGALAAAPAPAAPWMLGGSTTGSGIVGPGPVVIGLPGGSYPCTATLAVTDLGGAPRVTAVTLTGSAPCTALHASGLPWQVSAPVPIAGAPTPLWSGTVLAATLAGPVTCSGHLAMQVIGDDPVPVSTHAVVAGTLGACTVASGGLPTDPVLAG